MIYFPLTLTLSPKWGRGNNEGTPTILPLPPLGGEGWGEGG